MGAAEHNNITQDGNRLDVFHFATVRLVLARQVYGCNRGIELMMMIGDNLVMLLLLLTIVVHLLVRRLVEGERQRDDGRDFEHQQCLVLQRLEHQLQKGFGLFEVELILPEHVLSHGNVLLVAGQSCVCLRRLIRICFIYNNSIRPESGGGGRVV